MGLQGVKETARQTGIGYRHAPFLAQPRTLFAHKGTLCAGALLTSIARERIHRTAT
jgi:hypothetical protein